MLQNTTATSKITYRLALFEQLLPLDSGFCSSFAPISFDLRLSILHSTPHVLPLGKQLQLFLCLCINVRQIGVQPAGQQKNLIPYWMMFFKILFVHSTPTTNRARILCQNQGRKIVISDQHIVQPIIFIMQSSVRLFHCTPQIFLCWRRYSSKMLLRIRIFRPIL